VHYREAIIADGEHLTNSLRYVDNSAKCSVNYCYPRIRSYMQVFDWYKTRWPWALILVILRHFTESGMIQGHLRQGNWSYVQQKYNKRFLFYHAAWNASSD